MPASTLRTVKILACSLLMALLAIAHPAQAQVPPRITVDSIPPGANVSVDGVPQGQSGPNFKVRMNRGQHRVRLELEGHKPFEQMVTITAAQKFTFPLEKAPARLDIKFPATNDGARGAEIFVDGTPAGTVPQLVDVPAGRHLVEVRKQGSKVYTETVEVRASESHPIWVQLQADVRQGSLLIAADAAAEVFVDGQPKGQAPTLIDNLTEGEHVVEVRRAEKDAPVWRQTVRVLGSQQTKVMAQTQAPPPAAGSLLIISTVADAEVMVDGASRGKAGAPIALPPGQHSVTVQAKGYNPVTKVIEIEPGKPRIEKVDMVGDPSSRGVGMVRIIMANPIEGAQYFVNGRRIDESAALSDQGVEVAAGHVIVVVKKDGFGSAKKEIELRPGGTEAVTLELRNVGRIQVSTDPRDALVIVDGALVGRTPMTVENIVSGPHTVELQQRGFEPIVQQVMVRSGEQENISTIMRPVTAPPPDEKKIVAGLSSWSAVVNQERHFTGDVGAGFPYFASLRLTVGVKTWKIKSKSFENEMGFDVGAEMRTSFMQTEAGLNLRFQLFKKEPFAIGLNTNFFGGGGPRRRNTFGWELGLPITLLAGNKVKLTARPYLQVYTDRHCPAVDQIQTLAIDNDGPAVRALGAPIDDMYSGVERGQEHAGDRCVGASYDPMVAFPNPIYDAVGYNSMTNSFSSSAIKYDPTNRLYQVDGTGVLDRFVGVRFMLQASAEIAIAPNMNLWGMLEGAPFQSQRQGFTDKFNRFMPITDTPIYGRLGVTLKY